MPAKTKTSRKAGTTAPEKPAKGTPKAPPKKVPARKPPRPKR